MKKLTLILLATAVASSAFAWIENPTMGEYREFSTAGEVPAENTQPLIQNSIEGEYREFSNAGDPGAWIHGWLWVLRV